MPPFFSRQKGSPFTKEAIDMADEKSYSKNEATNLVARLLGHSNTETTEKRYVKYRDEVLNDARRLMV